MRAVAGSLGSPTPARPAPGLRGGGARSAPREVRGTGRSLDVFPGGGQTMPAPTRWTKPSALFVAPLIATKFDAGGVVMLASLRTAAPLLVAAVIANFTAALASRAAPALNAFSVMLALFLIAGIAALWATAPALVQEILRGAASAADAPARLFSR